MMTHASLLPSARSRVRRRGVALVYMSVSIVAVLGVVSLAVDYGRAQEIKEELQRCADAAALAALNAYADTGSQSAAATAALTIASQNTVESGSGVNPTVSLAGGVWNASTRTFTASGVGTPAARVTVSRTAANNNAVQLYFAKFIGMSKCDISATATATLVSAASGSVSVPATSNPYLGGVPSGTSTPWGDSTYNATPYQVASISVVPGTWITFTGGAGTTCIVPGYTGNFGPEGEATRPLHHGENYDGTEFNIGPENGIADAIIPATALYGVFLTDAAPTSRPAPTTVVDWSSAAVKDKPTYTNLEVQAPFMIGDGMTSGGTVQKFLVPPGATRLYLGVWDGVVQSNNTGTLTGTINLKRSVRLVE